MSFAIAGCPSHGRSSYALTPRSFVLPADLEALEARLADAGGTLMRLAVRGCAPGGYRGFWPEIVQEAAEAYGYTEEDVPVSAPNARAISQMDEVLGWVNRIPLDPGRAGSGELWSTNGGALLRRLVLDRMLVGPRTGRRVFSWKRLGHKHHTSHETARQWHAMALDRILAELRLDDRVARLALASGGRRQFFITNA